MQTHEYKVVPAPNRPKRVKGVRGTSGRFAALLTETINDLAKDGWEYMRSDSLPVEEKPGLLKSRVEIYQTVLVFRRPVATSEEPQFGGYITEQSQESPAEPNIGSAPKAIVPEEPSLGGDWTKESEDAPQDPPVMAADSTLEHPEPQDEAAAETANDGFPKN